MVHRALLPAFVIFTLGCDPESEFDDDSTEDPEAVDPGWATFLDNRDTMLQELSVPIVDCIGQSDTDHPAFHGCWDWHSAVHGTWAALAVGRHTGLSGPSEAAGSLLTEEALSEEHGDLSGNGLYSEIPYGYAWFLRLARQGIGESHPALLPLGVTVGDRLEFYIDSLSDLGIQLGLTANSYQNLSWVLTNLHDWAVFQDDEARVVWLQDFIRDQVLSREDECPVEDDEEADDQFFPPCLLRARAIARILPPGEAQAWAVANLPEAYDLRPLEGVSTDHSAGLTWSRAWALWDLWKLTGDLRWRTMYREHVESWYAQPQYWAEDYQSYAHWVAQFGVHAIDLSYDEPVAVGP